MSKYGKILLCICLLDLFLTVTGLQLGLIGEENGLLLRVLDIWGVEALVVAKVLLTIPGIFLCELALRRPSSRYRFPIKAYYKFAIWGYVASFIFLTIFVNFF